MIRVMRWHKPSILTPEEWKTFKASFKLYRVTIAHVPDAQLLPFCIMFSYSASADLLVLRFFGLRFFDLRFSGNKRDFLCLFKRGKTFFPDGGEILSSLAEGNTFFPDGFSWYSILLLEELSYSFLHDRKHPLF